MSRRALPAFLSHPVAADSSIAGSSPAPMLILTLALALGSLVGTACRDSSAGGRIVDSGQIGDGPDAADRPAIADANCSTDGPGGGVCPLNYCGYLRSAAALALDETAQGGADSLCNQGRICLATVVAASGDALVLSCLVPRAGGLDFGMACSKDPASSLRCKDDSLCIAAPDAPAELFCTTLCRVDADCPADSACLEYQQPVGSSSARVGQCTPKSKIHQTFCTAERDCPAGQGCVRVGDRSVLLICKPGGTKSMGETCTAPAECRSRECYDRDFRIGSTATRASCSGVCAKNSDCGPDQRCVAKVLGNNGTISDPFDDVVVGYCRSLFAATIATACENDTACVAQGRGADTCDPTYGICYKRSATGLVGAPCTSDDGCDRGGACALGPTFAGGTCVFDGCAISGATGTDVCPGARSVCSQRVSDEPLHRCYEGCTTAGGCSRAAENYFCAPAKTGQAISICLSR